MSLGGAEDEAGQDGADAGLLELPERVQASFAAAPRGVRGAGSGDGSEFPAGGLHRGRRESLEPLSARLRSRTGFRGAVLLGVLAAVLSGFFWWQVATGTPEAVPLSEVSAPAMEQPPAGVGGIEAMEALPGSGQGAILVHVAGAVATPGVVQIAAGSRLHEAVAAAGGATAEADPDRLNLASVLEDGQKVLVPARGDPVPAGPVAGEPDGASGNSRGESGPAGGRKIDLNSAGVEELGTLPRVGPVLAQRIVDWRRQHGRFKTVEELDAVDGVGPKLLQALLPLVRV